MDHVKFLWCVRWFTKSNLLFLFLCALFFIQVFDFTTSHNVVTNNKIKPKKKVTAKNISVKSRHAVDVKGRTTTVDTAKKTLIKQKKNLKKTVTTTTTRDNANVCTEGAYIHKWGRERKNKI